MTRDPSGSIETIEPVPSWRTNIAKRLNRLGRLHPWRRLMTMERRRFRSVRPNANYAQARAIMLFLHERGKLGAWFRKYLETYDEDRWGMTALERVFDQPLETIEREFKAWLTKTPEVAEQVEPGMASLGVVVSPGRGDGPRIDQLAAGTPAGDAGLRMRDVILAIDGRPTRTLAELVRVLSEYEPGDVVNVTVRRGTRRLTLDVPLTAR